MERLADFTFAGSVGPVECLVEPNRSERDAVLIMAHGFRGSREGGGRAAGVARQAACCCDVVRFNFTGTRVISQQVEELTAVLDEVRRRRPRCKLYLLGRSLGGAASIIVAGRDKRVGRLILWAAPNDLRYTFRYVMGDAAYARLDAGETLYFTDERGCCELPPTFLTDFDNYDLSRILQTWDGRPVLLLHCAGDATVLAAQARRNAELLGAAAELHLFPGGDHSFSDYSAQAGALIAAWLQKDA